MKSFSFLFLIIIGLSNFSCKNQKFANFQASGTAYKINNEAKEEIKEENKNQVLTEASPNLMAINDEKEIIVVNNFSAIATENKVPSARAVNKPIAKKVKLSLKEKMMPNFVAKQLNKNKALFSPNEPYSSWAPLLKMGLLVIAIGILLSLIPLIGVLSSLVLAVGAIMAIIGIGQMMSWW